LRHQIGAIVDDHLMPQRIGNTLRNLARHEVRSTGGLYRQQSYDSGRVILPCTWRGGLREYLSASEPKNTGTESTRYRIQLPHAFLPATQTSNQLHMLPCSARKLDVRQRLVEIRNDIVDMLDANGQSHHFLADTRPGEFLRRQLPVRRRRRMTCQRFAITDVDQAHHQLQRILKSRATLAPTLDTESQYARSTPAM